MRVFGTAALALAITFSCTGCGGSSLMLRPDPEDAVALSLDKMTFNGVNVQDGFYNSDGIEGVYQLMTGEDAIHTLAFLQVHGHVGPTPDSAVAEEFQKALATELGKRHSQTDDQHPVFTVLPMDKVMSAPSWSKKGDAGGPGLSSTSRYYSSMGMISLIQDDEWMSNLQRETGAQAFIIASGGKLGAGTLSLYVPYNLVRQASDRRSIHVGPNAMNSLLVITLPTDGQGSNHDVQSAAAVIAAYLNAYLHAEIPKK